MSVLLTGATGLLGGAVLNGLLGGGHEVRVLLREGSPRAHRLAGLPVEVAVGDASRAGDVRRASEGVRAVVHVAGIEYAPAVVEGAQGAGVERLVAVSSTSAHSRYPSRSAPKREGEAVVRGSGLSWTVVRPAMIYGTEQDKNVRHLLRFLERSPVFPVFGDGRNLFQPVYYADCAAGVVAALERPVAAGRAYDLPGARSLAYADLVGAAARALGRRVRVLGVPLEPVRAGLAGLERLRAPLPFGSEQVERLKEDKAYPFEEAAQDLGYAPRPFEEGVALEVERLREVGYLGKEERGGKRWR